jgi:putative DNA primase/helicase
MSVPETKYAVQYLRDRGIDPEFAIAEGVDIQTPSTYHHRSVYRARLDFDVWGNKPLPDLVEEVLWYPNRDKIGAIKGFTARIFPELVDREGKSVKSLTTKGESFPFIPKRVWEAAEKTARPLYITEGVPKALSILAAGGLAISVSGVYMAVSNKAELHPAFEAFAFGGRQIYLAFDADHQINQRVRQALIRTAIILLRTGAEVKVICWPTDQGKGIDDFLFYLAKNNGTASPAETLKQLSDKARTIGVFTRPCDVEIVENELARIALSRPRLSQLCKEFGPPLRVAAGKLEDSVLQIKGANKGDGRFAKPPEPWPDKVDGAELAAEVFAAIKAHIVVNEHQIVAITLWLFAGYCIDAFDLFPLLTTLSPTKRCGKTQLMLLLGDLALKPILGGSYSTASLFRIMDKYQPTMLGDEIDKWLPDNKEIQGVINLGYTRKTALIPRCEGENNEIRFFSSWGPKALFGIGTADDQIIDRSIIIHIQRKKRSDDVARLRDTKVDFSVLRQKLFRWAADHSADVADAAPKIPEALDDRAGNNWEPLLAVAGVLGGDWPKKAMLASLALNDTDDQETVTTLLLARLQEIIENSNPSRTRNKAGEEIQYLESGHLVDELNKYKDMPWKDWAKGNGLSQRKLADMLRDFEIKPLRFGHEKESGYNLSDLKAAIERYVSSETPKNAFKGAAES